MKSNHHTDFDDVAALMKHLQLGDGAYREFGGKAEQASPQSAAEPVPARPVSAAASTKPAEVRRTPVLSVAGGQQALVPAPLAREIESPLAPRAAAPVVAAPIAFTFERLRRQVIASAGPALHLQLDLEARYPVHTASPTARKAREWRVVFEELQAPVRRTG